VKVENQYRGNDDEIVTNKNINNSGMWLYFRRKSYVVFDGSHLTVKSAKKFSQDLYFDVKKRLKKSKN